MSPARRRLVELMRRVHFGRLEGLVVRGGEPVLDGGDAPRVFLEVKFGGENGLRAEAGAGGGVGGGPSLKPQVAELFAHFDRLVDALGFDDRAHIDRW